MTSFVLKRRYARAGFQRHGEGWALLLDDKPVKTPAGLVLVAPTAAMAQALADEWQAQDENIVPSSMPLNQLLVTALDRVATEHGAIVAGLLRFLDTELVCHFGADEALVAYQRQHWQPLHNWVTEKFGVMLPVTFGVQPIRAVLPVDIFASHITAYGDCHLAALSQAVAVSGSLVVGLALVEGHIDAAAALLAAEAEADFQQQKWGFDAESAARRQGVADDLAQVERFTKLLA